MAYAKIYSVYDIDDHGRWVELTHPLDRLIINPEIHQDENAHARDCFPNATDNLKTCLVKSICLK